MYAYPDVEKGQLSQIPQDGQEKSVSLSDGNTANNSNTWGAWLRHHGAQIAKGSVALLGLAVIGTVGYLVRGLFVRSTDTVDNIENNATRDQLKDIAEPEALTLSSSSLQPALVQNYETIAINDFTDGMVFDNVVTTTAIIQENSNSKLSYPAIHHDDSVLIRAPENLQLQPQPIARSVWPAIVKLGDLNGKNGFKIYGENDKDYSGFAVSNAGDINGDGIDDFVVGAWGYESEKGRSYVIFGSRNTWNNSIALSSLNGTNGFKIDGENNGDRAGQLISAAGDINGDGIDDLLIGALVKGRSYVVFGSRNKWNSTMTLTGLNGVNGFKIDAEMGGNVGSVSNAGDINDDGIDDLLIGSDMYGGARGRSYVVFGSKNGWSSVLSLSTLNGTNGFKIDGENGGDYSSHSVSNAGDINGDGIDDLVIGAFYAAPSGKFNAGKSYVVFGSRDRWDSVIALASLNGTNGFKIDGENANDMSGISVSGAGDVNGDGIDDLVVGATGHGYVGRGYVIFGSKSVWKNTLALNSLDGTNGFKIDGEGRTGASVSNAGDINGDGIDDLIVAAPGYENSKGRSYVIFGSKNVWSSTLVASNLNGINGFKVDGENEADISGESVSNAGDINGDGISDLVIGTYRFRGVIGRSYVVFGGTLELWNNQLTLNRCDTISLNSTHLNVTSNGQYDPSLLFTVTNLAHGKFSLVNISTVPITSFNQSQIANQQIQFTHDCSALAPTYRIQINCDKLPYILPTSANITYYLNLPIVVNNYLFITQGGKTNVTANYLSAIDPVMRSFADAQLTFTPSNLQHIKFTFRNSTSVAIPSFTQQQIKDEQVCAIHDSSQYAPSYLVIVSDGYVNSDLVTAVIQYGHVPPRVITNQLNIQEGETVPFSISNFYATDIDGAITPAMLNCTLSNIQHGYFKKISLAETEITYFSVQDILANSIKFSHDASKFAPSYLIAVSDGYNATMPLMPKISYTNLPPAVFANQISLFEGQTVNITAQNFNATAIAPFITAENITFSVINLQHGNFTRTDLSSSLIANFTLREVIDRKIQFKHDNSKLPPSYLVRISDGYDSTADLMPTVQYVNSPPVFRANKLTIKECETVLLKKENIHVEDVDPSISAAALGFTVDKIRYSKFSKVTDLATEISKFTLQDITEHNIRITHDCSKFAPEYQLKVTDGYDSSAVNSATVQYTNLPPVLVNNKLSVNEGDRLIVTADNLNATDIDPNIMPSSISFAIYNAHHGRFESILQPGITQNNFTLQQVLNGKIQYVHDGGKFKPSYMVKVGDGYETTQQSFVAEVSYRNLPSFLNVKEGQKINLTTSNFPSASVLTFMVDEIERGYFETRSQRDLKNFTFVDVQLGNIRFMHDGSKVAPNYKIITSNSYEKSQQTPVVVEYKTKPPIVLANKLIINQGDRIPLTGDNLFAYSLDSTISAANIIFNITNIAHGTLTKNKFSMQEVFDEQIIFTHDNSEFAPSYIVVVSDGHDVTQPTSARVGFNEAPRLINNQLDIMQGATVTLDSSNLRAVKGNQTTALSDLLFIIDHIAHGSFQRQGSILNPHACNFTQDDVIYKRIQFIHDNSIISPDYNVSVRDFDVKIPANATTVTFHLKPGLGFAEIFGIILAPTALISGAIVLFVYCRHKHRKITLLQLSNLTEIDFMDTDLKIVKQIGRGASGNVYEGNLSGTKVAVKMIAHMNEAASKDFLKESTLMKSLRHPNVVQFYGGGYDKAHSKGFLMMEFMEFGSLYDVLHDRKKYKLPWELRMQMAVQIASGIAFLHSKSIMHCDIKSMNFLVANDLTIKVSDFGASKIVAPVATNSDGVGTPYWSAPEVLRGEKNTLQSDVFSLVVVLWELLSRLAPYENEQQNEAQMAVTMAIAYHGKRVIIPPWTPTFFSNLITRGLDDVPNNRPSTQEIVTCLQEQRTNPFIPNGDSEEIKRLRVGQADLFSESAQHSENTADKKSGTIQEALLDAELGINRI